MKVHIKNGVDVDPNWTEVIAVSHDGQQWSTFRKDAVTTVNPVSSHNANRGTFGSPQRTKNLLVHITLRGGVDVNFDVQDVANQAAWSTGDLAGLNQAITDISSWL